MQNLNIYECMECTCPVGIEQVKKIGLSPQEKRAIFISLREEIFRLKKMGENSGS